MLRFFRQYYPIRNIFFVMGEGVFIYVSVLLAALSPQGHRHCIEHPWFYAKLFMITIVCQACLYYNELYDLKVTASLKELSRPAAAVLRGCGHFPGVRLSRLPRNDHASGIFMVGVGIVIVLIACWRFGYSLVLSRGLFNQQIMLLGSGDLTKKISAEIKRAKTAGTRSPWKCRSPSTTWTWSARRRPADLPQPVRGAVRAQPGTRDSRRLWSASGRNAASCPPRSCCAAAWMASTSSKATASMKC